jgi:hypothetical protein
VTARAVSSHERRHVLVPSGCIGVDLPAATTATRIARVFRAGAAGER